jgi:tetratricopeptide (TPR) repeat protein
MLGQVDVARRLLAQARALSEELGLPLRRLNLVSEISSWVEMIAGDPEAAERERRWGFDLLERAGEKMFLSTAAAELANALYAQGRYDEAERYVAVAQSTGASDDVITQAMWRQVRAKVLARGGNRDEAGRLAQEAVALMEPTDALDMRADGLVDLAEVLRLCGRPDEAVESLHRAIHLYERKEHLVGLRRARTILTELD